MFSAKYFLCSPFLLLKPYPVSSEGYMFVILTFTRRLNIYFPILLFVKCISLPPNESLLRLNYHKYIGK